jgi:hypothetical protein
MKTRAESALVALGWLLIVGPAVLGLWSVVELVMGQHEILGGPVFAARTLLTWLITMATPIGVGVALLTLADLKRARS